MEKSLMKLDFLQEEIIKFRDFGEAIEVAETDEERETLSLLLERHGRGWKAAEWRTSLGLSQNLYLSKKYWDDLYLEWREIYQDEWRVYSRQISGKADGTIDNYIRVYKTWFSKEIELKLPEVTIWKEIEGEEVSEARQLNPWDIDPSKLLICTAIAKKGEMRQKDWNALADENVTCGELSSVLYDKEDDFTPGESPPPILFKIDEGGEFTAERAGDKVYLGYLDVQGEGILYLDAFDLMAERLKVDYTR